MTTAIIILVSLFGYTVAGAAVCATLEHKRPGFRAWYEEGRQRFGVVWYPLAFLLAWPALLYLHKRRS